MDSYVDYDYEELYFNPASEEEQIIRQIRKIGIPEIAWADNSLR